MLTRCLEPRFHVKSRLNHFIYLFYNNTSVNSHSQLSAYSKETHTKRSIESVWNSAKYGAIKHVPQTGSAMYR